MTISTTTCTIEHDGDGSSVDFAVPFVFLDETTLTVYKVRKSTKAATVQLLSTDYTVSGGAGATGTVTMTDAPSALYTIRIVRNEPMTQTTDYVNNSNSDADVQEAALDKLTIIAQQISNNANRSLHLAESELDGFSTELPAALGSYPTYTIIVNDAGNGFTLGVPTTYANGDGRFIKRTILTSTGTHTFTTQSTTGQLYIRMVGGGGGGSPVNAAGANGVNVGGGGGAGGYIEGWMVIRTPATAYSYTIGAGAAAVTPTNSPLSGDDTVFVFELDTLTAPGGAGASLATDGSFFSEGGLGGLPSIVGVSANFSGFATRGGNGKAGFGTYDGVSTYGAGGEGGASPFGPGGHGTITTTQAAGTAAVSKGSGGGGAAALNLGTASNGGAGGNGYIIIDEYTGGTFNSGA